VIPTIQKFHQNSSTAFLSYCWETDKHRKAKQPN